MARKSKQKLGDVGIVLRVANASEPDSKVDSLQHKRRLVADLCRMVGTSVQKSSDGQSPPVLPNLSPRMRQTLERLLAGDSEKQIALKLGVSRHTVHVYVKALYRGFDVNSRGELLARFVQTPQFKSAPSKKH